MPYISSHIRKTIDPQLKLLLERSKNASVGELNYIISRICDAWLHAHALGPKYSDFNDIIGVLECARLEMDYVLERAKTELYYRLVRPYEDEKRSVNGEVFTNLAVDLTNVPSDTVDERS